MIKNQKSHTTILKIHFSDLDIYNSRKNFPKVFCTNYSRNLCHSAICLLGEAKTSFQWCSAVPSHLSPPSSNRPITWKPKLKTVFQKSTTGFFNPLFRNKMKFKHNEMLLRNASKFFVIHFVQLCIFFFFLKTFFNQTWKILTSFLVTRSQSRSMNSSEIFFSPSSIWGNSNTNDSLNTGFKVRFFTCVFFLAIRWPLNSK